MSIIAFDIDDTLYKVDRKNKIQIPDYDIIQVLRWYVDNGDRVHVWSAGGIDYAQMVVNKLGLTDHVIVIEKSKASAIEHGVDICYDDEIVELAKVNIRVKRI